MPDSTRVSHWIDLVKEGDAEATNRIWGRYFGRLVRAVRPKVLGGDRAVSDEEDIVLSVFDSFYAAAERGRFPDLADRDDLWRLLMRMAARKVVDKRRHDRRQRRGGDVDVRSLDAPDSVLDVIGEEPSPEFAAELRESVEQIFSRLGVGPLRDLAGAKLEGHTNAELARRFACSERTIERRLRLIREKCRLEEVPPDERPPEETAD